MGLFPVSGLPAPVMLSTISRVAIGPEFGPIVVSVGSLSTTVNQGRIAPLYIPEGVLIRKVFWLTSTTPGGNMDVGIYDQNYQLIVSCGSTAMGAASTLVEADITDTPLARGSYYLAFAADFNAASVLASISLPSSSLNQITGTAVMASAFPLPATFVPAAIASASFPLIGVSQRTLVA